VANPDFDRLRECLRAVGAEPRGPLSVCVLWTVECGVFLRTHSHHGQYGPLKKGYSSEEDFDEPISGKP